MNGRNSPCSRRQRIERDLTRKKDRLNFYYEKEKEILNKKGVKSYTAGTRSLTRYDVQLKEIAAAIDKLERDIHYLEGILCGVSPRRAIGVVPRDW